MGDASAEQGSFCIVIIQVKWISVSGNLSKLSDMIVSDKLLNAPRHTNGEILKIEFLGFSHGFLQRENEIQPYA